MQLATHGQWWSIFSMHLLHWRQWWVLSGFAIRHRWHSLTPPCFFCSIETIFCFCFSFYFFSIFNFNSVFSGMSLYSLLKSYPCLDIRNPKSKSSGSLGYIMSCTMSSLSSLSCSLPIDVVSLPISLAPPLVLTLPMSSSGRSYSRFYGTLPGSVLIVSIIARNSWMTRNAKMTSMISHQNLSLSFSLSFAQ